ncbi:MAG: hypothetical protein GX772_11855 [Alcaligenaceae bacterium]|nr:hypothetical protein [Alcaligenaceae bacterium]
MSATTPADFLKHRLVSVLSGNFASENDIKEKGRKVESYGIRVQTDWGFGARVDTHESPGNPGLDDSRHFGENATAFEQCIQELKETARQDTDIRSRFMAGLHSQGGASMARLDDSHVKLFDYGRFSHHYSCSPCRGNGKVNCGNCRGAGEVTCHNCYGSRGRYEQRSYMVSDGNGRSVMRYEQVWVSCVTCLYSGYVTCGGCGGRRKVSCSPCEGHGFFTRFADVSLCAQANTRVSYEAGLGHEELLEHLKNLPYDDYRNILELTNVELLEKPDAGPVGLISYHFNATVSELALAVKDTAFSIRALGKQAQSLLSRPLIFDFLYQKTLAHWHHIQPSKRQKAVSSAEAQRLFDDLRNAKASHAVLELLAEGDGKAETTAESLRWNVCHGLMSSECAMSIVKAVKQSLDLLSPRYSEAAWSWAMMLPWLLAYMLSHALFEAGLAWAGNGLLLLMVSLVSLGLVLMAGVVVHPISLGLCRRQQAGLPQAFRRKQIWRAPMWRSIKTLAVVMVAGFLSGKLFEYWNLQAMEPMLDTMFSLLSAG